MQAQILLVLHHIVESANLKHNIIMGVITAIKAQNALKIFNVYYKMIVITIIVVNVLIICHQAFNGGLYY